MINTEALINVTTDLEEVGFQLSGMSILMQYLENQDGQQADLFRLLRANLVHMSDVILMNADKLHDLAKN